MRQVQAAIQGILGLNPVYLDHGRDAFGCVRTMRPRNHGPLHYSHRRWEYLAMSTASKLNHWENK